MFKNVWSNNNPQYNAAFHFSITNLKVWGMLTLLALFFTHVGDINPYYWVAKSVAYGFIGTIIIKTSHTFEAIYGGGFNSSSFNIIAITALILIAVGIANDPFWRVLNIYALLIPIRIFLGLKYKDLKTKKESHYP